MNMVTIPEKTWKKVERFLDELKHQDEWINAEEAAKMLGVQPETLTTYISRNKIKREDYTDGVGGNRFYRKSALQGRNKAA